MYKIRATRATRTNPGNPGYLDPKCREGQYIYNRGNETLQDLILRACQKFPNDVVDVEYNGAYQGRYVLQKHDGAEYYQPVTT